MSVYDKNRYPIVRLKIKKVPYPIRLSGLIESDNGQFGSKDL